MAIRGNGPGGSGRPARRTGANRVSDRSSKAAGGSRRGSSARERFADRFRRQRMLWIGANVLLALALVAGMVGTAVFGYSAYQDYRIREGHKEAQAAARQVVIDFLTISAASVDKDIQAVLDGSTGEFKKQYEDGKAEVRAAVIQNKVSSTGKVLRSGVVGGDADSVEVIVAADATVKNVNSPKGRKAHYRVKVSMAYDDGEDRWLVSRLEFVG